MVWMNLKCGNFSIKSLLLHNSGKNRTFPTTCSLEPMVLMKVGFFLWEVV